jgi:hypothetical protein
MPFPFAPVPLQLRKEGFTPHSKIVRRGPGRPTAVHSPNRFIHNIYRVGVPVVPGAGLAGFVVLGVGLVVAGAGVVVLGTLVPDEGGVTETGAPAPLVGGIVVAPGPVPGAHGAIMSALGAPFDPSVPAVPVVAVAPLPAVPVAPATPGFTLSDVVVPTDGDDGGTRPLVPAVGPASGTHGTVAGAAVGRSGVDDVPGAEVPCEADEDVVGEGLGEGIGNGVGEVVAGGDPVGF